MTPFALTPERPDERMRLTKATRTVPYQPLHGIHAQIDRTDNRYVVAKHRKETGK